MLIHATTVRKLVSRVFIFFVVFCGWVNHAKAYGPAISSISYTWVKDSTYQIYYWYFADCSSGASLPDSIAANMKNSCGFGDSVVYLHMVTFTPPTEIKYTCAGHATSCTTGSLPGYKQYAYVGNVTLYQRCDHWTFSVSEGLRDPSILNISSTSPNAYVEATLNNLDYQGNTAPYFANYVPFVFWDSVSTFDYIYGFDPNGDSVGFEVINPMSGTATSPINDNYNAGYSLTHPVSPSDAFVYDSPDMLMYLNPNNPGKYVLAYRLSDYKRITKSGVTSRVKVGSATMDEQIIVLTRPSQVNTLVLDTNSITGGSFADGAINVCSDAVLHFCIKMRTKSNYVNYTINGFYLDTMPKLYLTHYTTDSASACMTLPLSAFHPSFFELYYSLPDTACSDGFTESYLWRVPVRVTQSASAYQNKSFICTGDTMHITGYGDSLGTYVWGVLPGGSPISSLSCTTCVSPVAVPGVTTTYTLYTPDNLTCTNRDTFTVVVHNRPAMPIASSNSPICSYDTLRLSLTDTATVSTRRWIGPGGYRSGIKSPTIFPPISGIYKAYDSSNGCASYPDSVIVVVKPKPGKPIASSNSPICVHESLMLYATDTTAGVNYYWRTPDTSLLYIIPNPVIPFAAAGVYKSYVVLNGCTSDTAKLNVTVDSVGPPTVYIASNPDTVIPGFNMTFRAKVHNAGSHPRYQWQKNGVNIPGVTDSIYITSAVRAGDIMSVVVYSSLNCATPDSAIASTWPLGIEDLHNKVGISIFPNPNVGSFTVKGNINKDARDVKIAVLNLLGQVVYSDVATATNGNFSHDVKLPDIAEGVYIVQVNASGNAYFSRITLKR